MVAELSLLSWTLFGLIGVVFAVFVLPFSVKKVEHNLEIFLFLMGILAVSISRLWSKHLLQEALVEPIKITAAVFVAGLLLRWVRDHIRSIIGQVIQRIGIKWFMFGSVVFLGLFSSIITVIIASLILVEMVSALDFDKKTETNFVIIACFSLGLGAALTPIGEPLSTIAVSQLKGAPYYADFFFLVKLLGWYVLPGILFLGLLTARLKPQIRKRESLTEDYPESIKNVSFRAFKVYLFVMALVFLGGGLKPIVDTYIVKLPAAWLYWLNMISAILDNATLTAAEITPQMDIIHIQTILMGLLIAGGMLIPGNIPNIIAASKLKISSRDWARLGIPLGLGLMLVYFIALFWI